jgi:succinoglycan biosynthesis protein ExoM
MAAKGQGVAPESPGTRATVAVCIATFKRPLYLRATLESVARLRFERCAAPDLRVVVVDNDAARSAEATVEAMRERCPWPLRYAVEEERGIAHARNRLVREAGDADAIAFIDDDEIAQPQWLDELLYRFDRSGATAVLGPVVPKFEEPTEAWLVPFFERKDHADGEEVGPDDFRTSNVLLRAQALLGFDPPFCRDLAQTGGEDSYLGRLLHARGARYWWAARAMVEETNPNSRSTPAWLIRRRFRSATTLTAIRLKMLGRARGSSFVLWRTAGAAILGGFYLTKGAISGKADRLHGMELWSTVAGNVAGLFGVTYREYRKIHGR